MVISAWAIVAFLVWTWWYLRSGKWTRLFIWVGIFLALSKVWDKGVLRFTPIEPLDIPNYGINIPIVPNLDFENDMGFAVVIIALGCAFIVMVAKKWMGGSKR